MVQFDVFSLLHTTHISYRLFGFITQGQQTTFKKNFFGRVNNVRDRQLLKQKNSKPIIISKQFKNEKQIYLALTPIILCFSTFTFSILNLYN